MNVLASAHMTFIQGESQSSLRLERRLAMVLFVGLGALTMFDIVEDTIHGATLFHTLTEAVVVLFCAIGALYLWRQLLGGWRAKESKLREALSSARSDADQWRKEAAALSQGVRAAIDRQLEVWGLTTAERDVALLLMKGLSLKEIAVLRSTSERTVRQHAASIYRKSNLEGRAQLAAFFLDDILAESPASPS